MGLSPRISLDRDGYALVPQLFDKQTIDGLIAAFYSAEIARAERCGETFGARNILSMPDVIAVAHAPQLRACLGEAIMAVRGFFSTRRQRRTGPLPGIKT